MMPRILIIPSGRDQRAIQALSFINQYDFVLLSGGSSLGKVPGAMRMQTLLLKHGIDPTKIIVETQSRVSFENMLFCKALLDNKFGINQYYVGVATDRLHLRRFIVSFGASGIQITKNPLQHKENKLLEDFYLLLHKVDPLGTYILPFLKWIHFRTM